MRAFCRATPRRALPQVSPADPASAAASAVDAARHLDALAVDLYDHDSNDRAIVSAIIRMAQALGMQTTAEGVETEAQLEFLREQGCDEAQGYHFSRPLTPEALESFLRSQG